MGLTKYKLGELIELVDERNDIGIRDFYGINKSKEFMPTIANTTNLDESKYKIVRKNRFVFSGMQTGRDKSIRLVMYTKNKPIIVSPAYTTFEIKENAKVIPLYFFMLFLSEEKDRLGWFLSDASIRANLDWEVFCDIEINLPSIEIQKRYVAIYEAMLKNQEAYEEGLEDLKLACLGTIENIRKNSRKLYRIGDFIEPFNEKNVDESITLEQGINIDKKFITPHRPNKSLSNRKIVRRGQFAYCTQLNNENVAIAYRDAEDCVVSSVYDIFEITKKEKLLDAYLMLWIIRPEFGRFVYWASEGSAYEFLSYENLSNYRIPIPPIEIQNSIANIYKVYTERKEINEKLKEQIKSMCPILIRGAMEEASRKEE